jgi:hypothetical protein
MVEPRMNILPEAWADIITRVARLEIHRETLSAEIAGLKQSVENLTTIVQENQKWRYFVTGAITLLGAFGGALVSKLLFGT